MLRLVCLQSVVNGGLKPKIFDFYRREILQTYGFEHMLSLNNLEKAGLLKVQDARNPYASVKKTMKLIVEEDPDAPAPEDISHVYSGYAPLSVRLVQNFTKAGAYRGVEEVRAIAPISLPGPCMRSLNAYSVLFLAGPAPSSDPTTDASSAAWPALRVQTGPADGLQTQK